MPGVIWTPALAILLPSAVQPELGVLGGRGAVPARRSLPTAPPSLPGCDLTSSRWPTSTKAQVGWKAPVPQASRWVWL